MVFIETSAKTALNTAKLFEIIACAEHSAITVQRYWRGWQARCKYAWPPSSRLCRHRLLREFQEWRLQNWELLHLDKCMQEWDLQDWEVQEWDFCSEFS